MVEFRDVQPSGPSPEKLPDDVGKRLAELAEFNDSELERSGQRSNFRSAPDSGLITRALEFSIDEIGDPLSKFQLQGNSSSELWAGICSSIALLNPWDPVSCVSEFGPASNRRMAPAEMPIGTASRKCRSSVRPCSFCTHVERWLPRSGPTSSDPRWWLHLKFNLNDRAGRCELFLIQRRIRPCPSDPMERSDPQVL